MIARKLALTALLACSALTVPATAEDLRVALPTFPSKFAPNFWGNDGAPMIYQVYETLITRDPFARPLTYIPGLATEWKQIEPTVWELKLRDGVMLHDGTTMDADDVKFSLDPIFSGTNPEYTSAWGTFHYNFDRVEIVDPLTIHIHTKRPEPLFEALMSLSTASITSKDYYEANGYDQALLHPVGTGPYRVTNLVPGEEARMERFSDYWGDAAPFDHLSFRKVPEVASRITGLVNGEFDLVTNIPPDQAGALEQDGIRQQGVTWPMFHIWVLNQVAEPTKDLRVRQAMRLCTDNQQLVDGLWGGLAHVPKTHQFEEYGEPYYMADIDYSGRDVEKAKALLAEAGYSGAPIVAQFTQNYYLYGDLAAQVIQQQWQECGLNLQLQQVEKIDYEKSNIVAWSNPMYYPDPMGAMDVHWSGNSNYARRGTWKPAHPDWEKTFDTARFATDVDERREAYRHLLEIDQDEAGWILLYEPHEIYGMREDISFDIPVAYRPYVLPLRAGQITIGK
ncbi:MAG: ABC transporter substrate-binding protein [Paracoccus sp. (in: a-proteobacteria)]|nr:ABC transporter substrate-binding protein [Paracoccus sp. (in: a-proteobacteria)]